MNAFSSEITSKNVKSITKKLFSHTFRKSTKNIFHMTKPAKVFGEGVLFKSCLSDHSGKYPNSVFFQNSIESWNILNHGPNFTIALDLNSFLFPENKFQSIYKKKDGIWLIKINKKISSLLWDKINKNQLEKYSAFIYLLSSEYKKNWEILYKKMKKAKENKYEFVEENKDIIEKINKIQVLWFGNCPDFTHGFHNHIKNILIHDSKNHNRKKKGGDPSAIITSILLLSLMGGSGYVASVLGDESEMNNTEEKKEEKKEEEKTEEEKTEEEKKEEQKQEGNTESTNEVVTSGPGAVAPSAPTIAPPTNPALKKKPETKEDVKEILKVTKTEAIKLIAKDIAKDETETEELAKKLDDKHENTNEVIREVLENQSKLSAEIGDLEENIEKLKDTIRLSIDKENESAQQKRNEKLKTSEDNEKFKLQFSTKYSEWLMKKLESQLLSQAGQTDESTRVLAEVNDIKKQLDKLAKEHGLEFDSTIGFNLPPEEIAVLIKKIIPPKNTEDSCKKIGEKLNDGKPAGKDHCASILEKLKNSSPSTGEKNKCKKIKDKLQSPADNADSDADKCEKIKDKLQSSADAGDSNDNTEKCKKIKKKLQSPADSSSDSISAKDKCNKILAKLQSMKGGGRKTKATFNQRPIKMSEKHCTKKIKEILQLFTSNTQYSIESLGFLNTLKKEFPDPKPYRKLKQSFKKEPKTFFLTVFSEREWESFHDIVTDKGLGIGFCDKIKEINKKNKYLQLKPKIMGASFKTNHFSNAELNIELKKDAIKDFLDKYGVFIKNKNKGKIPQTFFSLGKVKETEILHSLSDVFKIKIPDYKDISTKDIVKKIKNHTGDQEEKNHLIQLLVCKHELQYPKKKKKTKKKKKAQKGGRKTRKI